MVHWDRYRAFIHQHEAMGWPLDIQAITAAIKETTTIVSVPINCPNPDFHWLQLQAKRRQTRRVALQTGPHEGTLQYRCQDALFKRHRKRPARERWKQKCESFDGPWGGHPSVENGKDNVQQTGPVQSRSRYGSHPNISNAAMLEILADKQLSPPSPPAARKEPPGRR